MNSRHLFTIAAVLGLLGVGCENSDYTSRDSTSTTSSREPDNTARNERDRSGTTMTPPDQQESELDLSLTTRIRQAITDGEDFSVNARNIKIVSSGGRVTLRGPVDSLEERDRVAQIAAAIAGAGNVDNQLEVKGSVAPPQN
jgi:osmotically-inducible protein OsmY